MALKNYFSAKAVEAMTAVGIPADCAPNVQYSAKPEFGDLQINGAMGAAKRLGQSPRDIAQQIVEHLDVADSCSRVEIAGPGFINLTLNMTWLSAHLQTMSASQHLGVTPAAHPQTGDC